MEKTRIKHVAWDVDGTLINTAELWIRVVTQYCREHDLPVPNEAAIKFCYGNSAWQGFSAWQEAVGPGFPMSQEQMRGHLYGFYDKLDIRQNAHPEELPPFSGIIELVKGLPSQSIVTSRPREALDTILGHLKIREHFAYINTRECAKELHLKDKPAADKLQHVMQQLSVAPGETLMIGDTIMDIGMAKNAGVTAVGVAWGMGTKQDLEDAGADYIVTKVADLKQLIEALSKDNTPVPVRALVCKR